MWGWETHKKYFIFIIYNTMKKVNYTTDDKIQAVQELVDALWQNKTINKENYMMQFSNVLNAMVEELWYDKTKKGVKVNDRFAQFLHFEFLHQYSEILWFDLDAYRVDLKEKLNWNLNL